MPIGGGTWPAQRTHNARISAQLSLRLDAGLADDFPPLRYFRPEAGDALLGRAGDRLVTERRQAFLHVRPDYGFWKIPPPPTDDVARGARPPDDGGHPMS